MKDGLGLKHLEHAAKLLEPHGDNADVAAALLTAAATDAKEFFKVDSIRIPK